ncbi:MAG: glutamine synthetase, partial [Gammaproteobacteria bacterium]
RHVLQNVLDRFVEMQLTPVIALEMEFYLFDENKLQNNIPLAQRFDSDTNLYDLDELHDNEAVIIEIQHALVALDIPADTFVNENAPGQFEINLLHHNDAMLAADQAFLFKRAIKACAKNHGKVASFMAKPLPNFPGNGMHMHMSLLDNEGNNIFTKQGNQPGEAFGNGIAGILDTLPDTLAFLAPHANSYRRLNGSGLAPTTLSWGWENRTSALRLPLADDTNQRIEHRVGSADANPYLVIAAILAGVHHGLTNQPALSEATYGNAYAQHEAVLSMTWEQAVKRCTEADFTKEYFGAEFAHLFGAIKAQEIKRFQETINDFEYFSYLRNS